MYKIFFYSLILSLLTQCSPKHITIKNDFVSLFQSNSNNADLGKLNSIKWDRLYILSPYVQINNLDSVLINAKSTINESGITIKDDIIEIIIMNGNNIVASFEVKRNIIDTNLPTNGYPIYFQPTQTLVYRKKSVNNTYIITDYK
ncbi:MAG: hypothetical protein COW65_04895 [Cytophagales bacterium CG18_big_fil_WC_8_21_14_2_50_42_9]|nr:MAG: hypothetical protein COW65_04895 [Cytophagales bacterium CG18_big_fil_WC_8_21_14_2_50_42_9]